MASDIGYTHPSLPQRPAHHMETVRSGLHVYGTCGIPYSTSECPPRPLSGFSFNPVGDMQVMGNTWPHGLRHWIDPSQPAPETCSSYGTVRSGLHVYGTCGIPYSTSECPLRRPLSGFNPVGDMQVMGNIWPHGLRHWIDPSQPTPETCSTYGNSEKLAPYVLLSLYFIIFLRVPTFSSYIYTIVSSTGPDFFGNDSVQGRRNIDTRFILDETRILVWNDQGGIDVSRVNYSLLKPCAST